MTESPTPTKTTSPHTPSDSSTPPPSTEPPSTHKLVRFEELSRSELRKRNPVSTATTAIVFVDKRGKFVPADSRLTQSEIFLDTPKGVYSVDITPHSETFKLELPTKNNAISFDAEITISWRVTDAVRAITSNVENPGALILPQLEQRLREVTRNFDVEANDEAERAIQGAFAHKQMVTDCVAMLSCVARLSLDHTTKNFVAGETRRIQQQGSKLHQLELSKQLEEQKHELDRLRADRDAELEKLKQEYEIQLKRQKMTFFADALRQDDVNLLALRLAGHGEEVNEVIGALMEQRRISFEAAQGLLRELLSAQLVDRKEVASILNNASKALVERLNTAGSPRALEGGEASRQPPIVPVDAERADLDDDRGAP
jgi:hypothetical protein